MIADLFFQKSCRNQANDIFKVIKKIRNLSNYNAIPTKLFYKNEEKILSIEKQQPRNLWLVNITYKI